MDMGIEYSNVLEIKTVLKTVSSKMERENFFWREAIMKLQLELQTLQTDGPPDWQDSRIPKIQIFPATFKLGSYMSPRPNH